MGYKGQVTGESRVRTQRHWRELLKTLDKKEVEEKLARGDLALRQAFYYQKT